MTIVRVFKKKYGEFIPTVSNGVLSIDTTSHARKLCIQLSPFHLGPVPLYDGMVSRNMENAWQYAKVYDFHLLFGEIGDEYWSWAKAGWANPQAVRYPIKKGAKPEFLLWGGERLGYVAARKAVYWPLYRDAVSKTEAFSVLHEYYQENRFREIHLYDFDGYGEEDARDALPSAINNDRRPMGHAFVLAAMLIYGAEIAPAYFE